MTEPFTIYRVDTADVLQLNSIANQPHRHLYEELLVGISGGLKHFIDFDTTVEYAPYVSFVSKGKVHRVEPLLVDGKCDIWVIRFASEFIPETIFQLYTYFHDNANISFPANRCFNRIVTLCEMMYEEMQEPTPSYAIVRQLLSTVFTMLVTRKSELKEAVNTTQNETFANFLMLLEENFRRPVSVSFYADKLFMSVRNLNLICQQVLEKSVSEIVETRKLIEAKNLLVSTGMSVSEIGFELGYKEKAYFSRVFKKKAGLTPSAFRQEMKKQFS